MVEALLQADPSTLSQIPWLQDLPQQIQQHQHRQQLSQAETDQQEEEEQQQGWEKDDSQDQGSSLYHERQQLRLELEGTVEQVLVQLRGAAALQTRVQDRMQKSADSVGQDGADVEKLPLLRHVTREFNCIK